MTFEILIPVRNPTEVFDKTVESLVAQTDQDFSVLVSDNFSMSGQELIENALVALKAAGIAARKIQPPVELDRVEHWNWLHYQSSANWLKPLFAGDWLEPGYVALLRETAAKHVPCRYIITQYVLHRSGLPDRAEPSRWAGRFWTPAEMQDVVLRYAMQFGPPSAAAYERTAFIALGGYSTALPIVADSLLFCTLAARFGVAVTSDRFCHFQIHTGRFSIHLPAKRRDTLRETFTYYFMLVYHAWTERDHIPLLGFLRLLARAEREYLAGR